MKKWIFLIFILICTVCAFIFYKTSITKNHQDELYSYEYGYKSENTFAFINLELDIIKWIEKYPSTFLTELALIHNKRNITLSGWIQKNSYDDIKSLFLKNDYLGSIYITNNTKFTHITIQNKKLFSDAIKYYNIEKGILPSDINFTKIDYEAYKNFPVFIYSVLQDINASKNVKITTSLSIDEIISTENINTLVNQKWWPNTKEIHTLF